MTHLTLHFQKEFSQLLPKTAPFKCPHCLEERVDQMALMLHFGLDHDELEKQVKNFKQKQYSIKNVSLKVDKEDRYVKFLLLFSYTGCRKIRAYFLFSLTSG